MVATVAKTESAIYLPDQADAALSCSIFILCILFIASRVFLMKGSRFDATLPADHWRASQSRGFTGKGPTHSTASPNRSVTWDVRPLKQVATPVKAQILLRRIEDLQTEADAVQGMLNFYKDVLESAQAGLRSAEQITRGYSDRAIVDTVWLRTKELHLDNARLAREGIGEKNEKLRQLAKDKEELVKKLRDLEGKTLLSIETKRR